ncbi:aminotransferase class I/II-fold pyridoxal phosphate-dependent enzyme, partial [uncultured Akkermansia sp.]|uniref:aminotransferase class I/II-fold pyridoxal phosphate-dependent enzyme n=1 Tax=uncultured Akkermansia sp. TaxID=512294 RepID=UPI00260AC221
EQGTNVFSGKDIGTLLLVNPGNPSGFFLPKGDVLRLCQWTKTRGVRLIVDESFVDFSCGMPDNTLLKDGILEEYPHSESHKVASIHAKQDPEIPQT